MRLSEVFTVLDTETTGPNPFRDRVLQIGLAVFAGLELKNKGSRLVNPGVFWDRDRFLAMGQDGAGIEIPLGAYEVHKISDRDLAGSPGFEGVWPKLRIRPPTVGYNSIGFDLPILLMECKLHKQDPAILYAPHVDLMPFIAWHFRGFRSRKLGDVCYRFGIRPEGAGMHDATTDCVLTGKLLAHLIQVGVIPDDVDKAIEQRRVFKEAVDDEFKRYLYWFYEDRIDGRLRMGCGKHTGKLISEVPKKAWVDLVRNVRDAPEHIMDMFKEFAR